MLQERTADPSTLTTTKRYSEEKLDVRRFDEQRWRKITGDHDYNDVRKKKKTTPDSQNGDGSPSSRSNQREADDDDDYAQYEEDEGSSINLGWLAPILQYLFYAAIAIVIIIILYQIVRNTSFNPTVKRGASPSTNAEDIHDITDLDTESLLREAHLAGNYRLAIRLYFLHLLKKLNENGTIAWAKDKTNRDYLSELFSKQYYFDEIRMLTLAYERVWYGEHTPTPEAYQQLSSEFKAIDQKLNSPGAL
jgi:hypothetical protein